MRYQLPVKNLFCWLICYGLLSLQGVAIAQVYKSYDANGNVIFSDKPTQRSEEVEITKPNVSDSFETPPPSAEPSPETKSETKPASEPVTQPIAEHDPADTNKDGRVSRREKEAERDERRKKKREEAKAAEGNQE